MEYTFGQAKKILRSAAYLHGDSDKIGDQINSAIMSLAGLNGWDFLRRLVRTFSASPVFSLPQGTAELTRICINGTPASLHPQDYQFLHSGPGDLDRYISRGFTMLKSGDVADCGFSPLLVHPTVPTRYAAVSDSPGHTSVTVTGVGVDGKSLTAVLPVEVRSAGDPERTPSFSSADFFSAVYSVVLGDGATGYTDLYAEGNDGSQYVAASYHPSVRVPKFHQYRIAPTKPGPYDILAEVRVDPLPLIRDDDVVPLPSLEPIKHMLLYEANLAMNELQTAQMYMQQAVQWLQQMQQADNTIQTPVVQNTLFEGSVGELSTEYFNL